MTCWIGLLALGTLIDTPFVQRFHIWSIAPQSNVVRAQLRDAPIDISTVVLTQSNLVPHIRHVNSIYTIGGRQLDRAPDIVLLTTVGGIPWPVSEQEYFAIVESYRRNPAFEEVSTAPLTVFRRR